MESMKSDRNQTGYSLDFNCRPKWKWGMVNDEMVLMKCTFCGDGSSCKSSLKTCSVFDTISGKKQASFSSHPFAFYIATICPVERENWVLKENIRCNIDNANVRYLGYMSCWYCVCYTLWHHILKYQGYIHIVLQNYESFTKYLSNRINKYKGMMLTFSLKTSNDIACVVCQSTIKFFPTLKFHIQCLFHFFCI